MGSGLKRVNFMPVSMSTETKPNCSINLIKVDFLCHDYGPYKSTYSSRYKNIYVEIKRHDILSIFFTTLELKSVLSVFNSNLCQFRISENALQI